MDTTWKPVPLQLTPEMRQAAEAAARIYMDETGGNSLDVIWAAAVKAAPAQPIIHELEIIVSDRNNTYRASPKACQATEAAGLQGQSASCTGGPMGALQRLLEKSTCPLDLKSAVIVRIPPRAGDPSYRTRYNVGVREGSE